jgi:hypothetical protein
MLLDAQVLLVSSGSLTNLPSTTHAPQRALLMTTYGTLSLGNLKGVHFHVSHLYRLQRCHLLRLRAPGRGHDVQICCVRKESILHSTELVAFGIIAIFA